MTAEELLQDLETRIAVIVAEQAAWVAQRIQNQTPANRTRTRAGIYWRATGLTASVGIRFARRYAGNTPTEKRLQSQWNELRPQVMRRIISEINQLFKG